MITNIFNYKTLIIKDKKHFSRTRSLVSLHIKSAMDQYHKIRKDLKALDYTDRITAATF